MVDEYLKLQGKWEAVDGSFDKHPGHRNLLKALRYCSKVENCFGVAAKPDIITTINFPTRLSERKRYYHVHKKENVIGTIVYHEC